MATDKEQKAPTQKEIAAAARLNTYREGWQEKHGARDKADQERDWRQRNRDALKGERGALNSFDASNAKKKGPTR
ncbi:hypothetical protein [Streptomyces axinellae]|uniref:DUF5302 domain-containing protein n=1 Tax=Streptomyces axinellae TaxID=552788 RepID=A0ABP6DEB2_9ACTN